MLAASLAVAGPSVTLPSLAEPLLQLESRLGGDQVPKRNDQGAYVAGISIFSQLLRIIL